MPGYINERCPQVFQVVPYVGGNINAAYTAQFYVEENNIIIDPQVNLVKAFIRIAICIYPDFNGWFFFSKNMLSILPAHWMSSSQIAIRTISSPPLNIVHFILPYAVGS